MTEAELAAIEERAKAATEGPWTIRLSDVWTAEEAWANGYLSLVDANGQTVVGEWSQHADDAGLTIDKPDAAFVAHARADVPALVAEVRRLREVIRRCDKALSAGGMRSASPSLDAAIDEALK